MTDAPLGADQPTNEGPAGPDGPADPDTPAVSGDAAVSAAAARAQFTRAVNLSDLPPLPVPEDTANVRQGPELHPACLSMLPLVGVWRGTGQYGNTPREEGPHFGQQITVAHDGRPFLRFESVTWRIASGADDLPTPGEREVGFLRPQPDGSLELLLTHAEGRIEVFYGQARSVASWAMSTDSRVAHPDRVTGRRSHPALRDHPGRPTRLRRGTRPHRRALGAARLGRSGTHRRLTPIPTYPARASDTTSRASSWTLARWSGPRNDSA